MAKTNTCLHNGTGTGSSLLFRKKKTWFRNISQKGKSLSPPFPPHNLLLDEFTFQQCQRRSFSAAVPQTFLCSTATMQSSLKMVKPETLAQPPSVACCAGPSSSSLWKGHLVPDQQGTRDRLHSLLTVVLSCACLVTTAHRGTATSSVTNSLLDFSSGLSQVLHTAISNP